MTTDMDKLFEASNKVQSILEGMKRASEQDTRTASYKVEPTSLDVIVSPDDLQITGKTNIGLLRTLATCDMHLCASGHSYRYFICGDVPRIGTLERQAWDYCVDYARKTGHLEAVIDSEGKGPQCARNAGVLAGSAPIVFFFDSGIAVHGGFFQHSIETLQTRNAATVRGVKEILYLEKVRRYYQRDLNFDVSGWGSLSPFYIGQQRPFRILSGSHSALAVRRSAWEAIGGYWNEINICTLDELYFDLVAAMFGFENWFDPRITYMQAANPKIHQPSKLEVARLHTAIARTLGGEALAVRTLDIYKRCFAPAELNIDIKAEIQRAESHRLWIESRRKFSLEELIQINPVVGEQPRRAA